MTMVPIGGMLSSAAGASLSQTAGSETERAQKDASTQRRAADADQKAVESAGIGQTQEDQESSERDADGRRLWEHPPEAGKKPAANGVDAEAQSRQSKDPTGQSGTQLDLTG
jgi:hypothetical protein